MLEKINYSLILEDVKTAFDNPLIGDAEFANEDHAWIYVLEHVLALSSTTIQKIDVDEQDDFLNSINIATIRLLKSLGQIKKEYIDKLENAETAVAPTFEQFQVNAFSILNIIQRAILDLKTYSATEDEESAEVTFNTVITHLFLLLDSTVYLLQNKNRLN